MIPDTTIQRLFVYGTLQPGGPNEHVLADIKGEWQAATVRGDLLSIGWGACEGYPGLRINPAGEDVAGFVLASAELSGSWQRLDDFEGEQYVRTATMVRLASGAEVSAFVYALREE